MVTENEVRPRNGVRAQHLLAIANMPANAGISQQTGREHTAAHATSRMMKIRSATMGQEIETTRGAWSYRNRLRSARSSNPKCVRTQPDILAEFALATENRKLKTGN